MPTSTEETPLEKSHASHQTASISSETNSSALSTFKCTRCAACCRKPDGYVYLTPRDITRLCTHLGISRTHFLQKYSRRTPHGPALAKKGTDCTLLSGNSCSLYPARPEQCRAYPFLPGELQTGCPGLN